MPRVAFSLTERIIIDPVLHMRAAWQNDSILPFGISKQVCHFAEAEIAARITALFISVFSAADAFIHLLAGTYKGGYLLLRQYDLVRPASWNYSEVIEHFRGAAFFASMIVVGSIVGAIWPGVFKYFRQSSLNPVDEGKSAYNTIPEFILDLAQDVKNNKESTPYQHLTDFWKDSNLSEKGWFVQAFNQDSTDFSEVRSALADTVYRPMNHSLVHEKVTWLNREEIAKKIPLNVGNTWEKVSSISQAFFFHATSEKALESILQTKKVEVRHERAYRGAFVSTQPECSFGKCILAFRRNIERLSTLTHGFTMHQCIYWAGFSRDIPVSENTLAYIMLDSDNEQEREALEVKCQKWTGRKIDVFLSKDAKNARVAVKALNMGIPKEWPEEGEGVGKLILDAMRPPAAVVSPMVAFSAARRHPVVRTMVHAT